MPDLRIVLALCAMLASACLHADDPRVRLSTSLGDIDIELNEERAPQSVDNFLEYVASGFYEGTLFHRVIEGFMIQGGGFTSDYQRKPTRSPIPNEANNGLRNEQYSISMARTNQPHSATSQFFINTVDNPALDHTNASARGWGYAVFGRVVDGFDVVDAISQVSTGAGGPFSRDAPREPVIIEKATLLDDGAPPSASETGEATNLSENVAEKDAEKNAEKN